MKVHIIIFALLAMSVTACAQNAAENKTTPTPTASTNQKRSLDQFDLNNGIRVSSPPSSSADYSMEKPADAEILDEDAFVAISQLIEHSNSIEAEFARVTRQKVDMDPGSPFQKWLQHSVMAIRELSKNYREGLFGWRVTSKANSELLLQNQYIAEDMMTLMSTAPAEYSKSEKDLRALSKVYGVPFPETGVDKAGIVRAMFAQLSRNFAKLKMVRGDGR